jgi:hypothetical protein
MADTSGKSILPSSPKEPASVIAVRMKMIFDIVEYHAIDKWGFKLLRAVVKESGFRTEAVIRAIESVKKLPSPYGITPEHIEDSVAIDLTK